MATRMMTRTTTATHLSGIRHDLQNAMADMRRANYRLALQSLADADLGLSLLTSDPHREAPERAVRLITACRERVAGSLRARGLAV